MTIRIATMNDFAVLAQNDKWIDPSAIEGKIQDKQIYVVYEGDDFVGWLRYGLFWDNTPFMNMLRLLEPYRGRGIGNRLVYFWEKEMKNKGYNVLMTSSAQNEHAQHFYVKLGYKAIGSFTLEAEPLEIIFEKYISTYSFKDFSIADFMK